MIFGSVILLSIYRAQVHRTNERRHIDRPGYKTERVRVFPWQGIRGVMQFSAKRVTLSQPHIDELSEASCAITTSDKREPGVR